MDKLRQEWAAFKALSFKKKLEHIWLYYKWFLISAAAVICVIVSIAGTVAENRKETLISGIFINNSTSQEGYAHLKDDYWQFRGGSEDQKAELVTGRTIHFDSQPLSQEDAASFMIVASMIAARTLDYIITDEASLKYFEEQEITADLRELLPEETLAQWEAVESGEAVIALKLAGTAFAENYPLYAADSCIMVVPNGQSPEKVIQFLDYLMNEA